MKLARQVLRRLKRCPCGPIDKYNLVLYRQGFAKRLRLIRQRRKILKHLRRQKP